MSSIPKDLTNRAFNMFKMFQENLDDFDLNHCKQDGAIGSKCVISKNKYTRKVRLIEFLHNFDITLDINTLKMIKWKIKYSSLFKENFLVEVHAYSSVSKLLIFGLRKLQSNT